ncbi:MAG: hypothetical protein CSB44_01995 [Gammaproteobacteria bacterium]|nr:MAG: hypothetical protein CSB44_01995 [Gammaproteobacteria bacterium]
MSRRSDFIVQQKTTINVLIFALLVMTTLLVYAMYIIATTRDNFTITIPPNMSSGAIVNVDEFNKSTVHAFAINTFRELNRWEDDGYVDYGRKIEALAPRFTAEFYEWLKEDMNRRNEEGELADRTRYTLELDGAHHRDLDEIVEVVDDSTWIVNVKITIVESIGGFEIKNRKVSYPLLVRRGNLSPTPDAGNWGLLLDGYPEGRVPEVIEDEQSESVQSKSFQNEDDQDTK